MKGRRVRYVKGLDGMWSEERRRVMYGKGDDEEGGGKEEKDGRLGIEEDIRAPTDRACR